MPDSAGDRRAARCAGTQRDGLGALLAQLAHALLARAFARVPLAVVDRVITCCALVALVAPLLLWISWSKTGFFVIIATAAAAVGIIRVLIWLYPEDLF